MPDDNRRYYNKKRYIDYIHVSPQLNTLAKWLEDSVMSPIQGLDLDDMDRCYEEILSYRPSARMSFISPELEKLRDSPPGTFTEDNPLDAAQAVIEIDDLVENKPQKGLFIIDENSLTNREQMYSEYTEEQREAVEYDAANIDENSPLVYGTKIAIPYKYVNKQTITMKGTNQLFDTPKFKTFYATYLRALLEDVNYKQVEQIVDVQEGAPITTFNNASVIMWIRGLSDPNSGFDVPEGMEPKELEGKWMDVTPFVKSIDTNVTENGGSFTIEFSPILCEGYKDGWTLKPNSVQNFNKNDIINQQTVAVGGIHRINTTKKLASNPRAGMLERNTLFFHHVVSPNDLVYIRFETLAMDYDDRKKAAEKFVLDGSDIPNRPYDMIGLVDVCSETTSGASSNVGVSIRGRDLSKVILDDGSYFYATPAHDLSSFTESEGDGLVQRLTANGRYPIMAEYAYRSIADSMMFLMNCVSGITVVPDSIFNGYGDRRVGKYKVDSDRMDFLPENQMAQVTVQDIIKANAEGDYSTVLYNPDITEPVLKENNGAFIGLGGMKVEDEYTRGIWQIIRLNVDDNIANRYLADSSIAYPDGSIIEQFRKICQLPMVEFYTDTYYDQFFFICRQPPWSGEHLRSLVQKDLGVNEIRIVLNTFKPDDGSGNPVAGASTVPTIQGKDGRIKKTKLLNGSFSHKGMDFIPKGVIASYELGEVEVTTEQDSDYMIKIYDQEVYSENLSFHGSPVYSIFEYTPSNLLLTNETFVMPLKEYAQVFGCSRLSIPSNYITYEATSQFNEDKSRNYVAEQIANDLVYIIETNAYLPFTRQGTIEIVGDRRIKIGMWIQYMPTDEYFYVDSVRQSYSTGTKQNRRTTLTVSRGMVAKNAKGYSTNINGEWTDASYFNLVNLELVRNVFYSYITGNGAENQNFIKQLSDEGVVNRRVFNYFLRREQFRNDQNIF